MACFGLEEQAVNNMDAKRVTASIAVNRIFIELPPFKSESMIIFVDSDLAPAARVLAWMRWLHRESWNQPWRLLLRM
ncbi:hypothetical protein D3C73_1280990 [compost metagenome]